MPRNTSLSPKPIDAFGTLIPPCEHFLKIYEDDGVLLDTLERFIEQGLRSGATSIVIATAAHLHALEGRMKASGLDRAAARWGGQYLPMDAEKTLARFMVDGWPDPALFAEVIGGLVQRGDGRRVRAFGEMVALLWAQGHHAATLRLEHLWNELCLAQALTLFCAYPRAGFIQDDAAGSMSSICAAHSRLIAA